MKVISAVKWAAESDMIPNLIFLSFFWQMKKNSETFFSSTTLLPNAHFVCFPDVQNSEIFLLKNILDHFKSY